MAAAVGSDDLSLPLGGKAKRQVRSGSTQQRTVGIKTFHGDGTNEAIREALENAAQGNKLFRKTPLVGGHAVKEAAYHLGG